MASTKTSKISDVLGFKLTTNSRLECCNEFWLGGWQCIFENEGSCYCLHTCSNQIAVWHVLGLQNVKLYTFLINIHEKILRPPLWRTQSMLSNYSAASYLPLHDAGLHWMMVGLTANHGPSAVGSLWLEICWNRRTMHVHQPSVWDTSHANPMHTTASHRHTKKSEGAEKKYYKAMPCR